jgi:hypothetical protein
VEQRTDLVSLTVRDRVAVDTDGEEVQLVETVVGDLQRSGIDEDALEVVLEHRELPRPEIEVVQRVRAKSREEDGVAP